MSEPPRLPWPARAPACGEVTLRAFRDGDVAMVRDLATDPYVPTVGTLPFRADEIQARDWLRRQRDVEAGGAVRRCVSLTATGEALGSIGATVKGEAVRYVEVGYAIAPSRRGRGHAAQALAALLAALRGADAAEAVGADLVVARVEPWNTASLRVARAAGLGEPTSQPRAGALPDAAGMVVLMASLRRRVRG